MGGFFVSYFERKSMKKGRKGTTTNRFIPTKRHLDLTLTEMFERFMVYKQSEGLSKITIRDYYSHFQWFCDYIGKDLQNEEITTDVFLQYVNYMKNELEVAPTTINIRIRTLRAFIRYCYQEEWIDTPIYERFKPIKASSKEVDVLTVAEIKMMFNQINDEFYSGMRDMVMLYTLLDTMVRISELLSIKRSNVDLKTGVIRLEADGTKTKRERTIPISTTTVKYLVEYIQETNDFENDILFLTYNGHKIDPSTVRKILRKYGDMAGIKKRVSPHIWRHSGAVLYCMNGGDPFSLQKILGHSHSAMTHHYVQLANTDIKKKHNSFSAVTGIFK